MQTTATRSTKYQTLACELIKELGHVSNVQLHERMKLLYPDLSATTVHRVTTRLREQGVVALAPPMKDGSVRYDANTDLHDHFMCMNCGGVRDIDIAAQVIPIVSDALGGCKITGRLLINGSCEHCLSKEGST